MSRLDATRTSSATWWGSKYSRETLTYPALPASKVASRRSVGTSTLHFHQNLLPFEDCGTRPSEGFGCSQKYPASSAFVPPRADHPRHSHATPPPPGHNLRKLFALSSIVMQEQVFSVWKLVEREDDFRHQSLRRAAGKVRFR